MRKILACLNVDVPHLAGLVGFGQWCWSNAPLLLLLVPLEQALKARQSKIHEEPMSTMARTAWLL